jgi:hypothetical protein
VDYTFIELETYAYVLYEKSLQETVREPISKIPLNDVFVCGIVRYHWRNLLVAQLYRCWLGLEFVEAEGTDSILEAGLFCPPRVGN